VDNGDIDIVIEIPQNFEKTLLRKDQKKLSLQ
jgi:uncharacterized phage infection (PIP) family protein YhgE